MVESSCTQNQENQNDIDGSQPTINTVLMLDVFWIRLVENHGTLMLANTDH